MRTAKLRDKEKTEGTVLAINFYPEVNAKGAHFHQR
jgi:hypothetical protein